MWSLLLCCWKRVFAMTSAFSRQNYISLCPASFCTPRPNLPVTPGISWFPTEYTCTQVKYRQMRMDRPLRVICRRPAACLTNIPNFLVGFSWTNLEKPRVQPNSVKTKGRDQGWDPRKWRPYKKHATIRSWHSLHASQVALQVKKPLANARDVRDAGWSLGLEDPLEEDIATHSNILAWRIPWTEEPGRLWSIGLQRVGHDWSNSAHTHPLHAVLLWITPFSACFKLDSISKYHNCFSIKCLDNLNQTLNISHHFNFLGHISPIDTSWLVHLDQPHRNWPLSYLRTCLLDGDSRSKPIGEWLAHSGRRQWHPTPILLPGKSHGWSSLVGCGPWGR